MVLCVVEHEAGAPTEPSLEAVTLSRGVANGVGGDLAAVAFTAGDPDEDGAALADALGAYGVDSVHVVDHPDLTDYAPEAWAASVSQLAAERGPDAVVGPGSERVHEVLAHVGARREQTVATNCVAVTPGETYELTRQRWGGTLVEEVRLGGDPKLLTTAEHDVGAERAAESADTSVHGFEPELSADDLRVQVARYEESDVEGVPLGEARVVVSGGRGVGSADGYDQLERLADLLGGAVGASRAAVNEGWRPHDDQVGQTGAKISPELYVACGISGAVQHMVGCKGAENILAVNTDPEAAIIQKADYAVVADLHEVVPAVNEAIRAEQD